MTMRHDIQVLRGLAILVVVLFHAHIVGASGGYLGVDIFFVISGFLITNLISKQIQEKTFSISEFYFRRAKRLLPAAYTTFFFTAIAACIVLTSQELYDFSNQLLGAITFTANMVLWRQGSYFGVESDLKPLLHIWSLAIEEQYYFILPAAMIFIPKKHWFKAIFVGCVLSLMICYIVYQIQAGAAFYLFPARAWELGIGSMGVFAINSNKIVKVCRVLFAPAIAIILYAIIKPVGGIHPGIDSLLVCFGTIIIILSNWQQPFDNVIGKLFSWLGDISYSLYLVHWPIFAFVNNLWFDDTSVPLVVRWACIAVSLLLGYLQYRFIEYPAHKSNIKFSKKYLLIGLGFSISIAGFALLVSVLNSKENHAFLKARRGNTGFAQTCTFNGNFSALPECQSTSTPDVMVWGDSNAMHLVPGIDATRGHHSIIQATKYVCGPVLDIAPLGLFTGTHQTDRWAKSCIDFNNQVLDYLAKNDSIKTVILSSYFSQYLTVERFAILTSNGQKTELSVEKQTQMVKVAFNTTINKIRALDKKVIIIAPPPAMDFDVGRCVERITRSMSIFGEYKDCAPPRSDIEMKRSKVFEFLTQLSTESDTRVLNFLDDLDSNGKILPTINGESVFIANAHLSYAGSIQLAKKSDFFNRALQLAK